MRSRLIKAHTLKADRIGLNGYFQEKKSGQHNAMPTFFSPENGCCLPLAESSFTERFVQGGFWFHR